MSVSLGVTCLLIIWSSIVEYEIYKNLLSLVGFILYTSISSEYSSP